MTATNRMIVAHYVAVMLVSQVVPVEKKVCMLCSQSVRCFLNQALTQIGESLAWPQPLTIRASASHENNGFLAFDMSRSISFAR